MILLSKSTMLMLSALTLTIASILSDGGTCKCVLFFLKFAGIKFRDFQAIAKLAK